jgi:hypothetical protein
MYLRGDLFAARFGSEGGLHILNPDKEEQACLVETTQAKFDEYQPPHGIDRKGGIKTKGLPVRRHFDRAANEVKDAILGTRPWISVGLTSCLGELLEAYLTKLVQQVID